MLNNKSDFILEYNEKTGTNLKRDNVDWSQSKVIFIANSFTLYQQKAINFKDLPIELWEVKKYENGNLSFEQIKVDDASESINTISKNKEVQRISEEVKTYSLDDHFSSNSPLREVYDELVDRVLKLDNTFEIRPRKWFIGFRLLGYLKNNNLFSVRAYKDSMDLNIQRLAPDEINDPENRAKYMETSMKNLNQHIHTFKIKSEADLDYGMKFIMQMYDKYIMPIA